MRCIGVPRVESIDSVFAARIRMELAELIWQAEWMPTSWKEIGRIFRSLVQLWQSEWGISAPLYGAVPSAELDAECDEWCRRLAKDLTAEIVPPSHVRPWLYARFAMAIQGVELLQQLGESAPETLSETLVLELLIEDWHACHRATWQKLRDTSGGSLPA